MSHADIPPTARGPLSEAVSPPVHRRSLQEPAEEVVMGEDAPAITFHRSRWSAVVACIVMAIAVLSIAGWAMDVWTLKALRPGWATMKVNTAVGLVFCSAVLLIIVRSTTGGRLCRFGVPVLCAVVIAIGGVTILEYVLGIELGIHGLLVRPGEEAPDRTLPGRMSPSTGFCLALVGAALIVAWRWMRDLHPLVAALGFSVALFGGFTLAGYVVDAVAGVHLVNYTGMAAHTAVCFVLLGSGLASLVPKGEFRGWRLGPRTTLGFVAGMALMLGAVGVAYHFTAQLLRTAEGVGHRQEGLKEIEELASGMAAVSSRERAFLLTNREDLLERWEDVSSEARESFEELRALTGNDPVQQRHLGRLEPVIVQRMEAAEGAVAGRRAGAAGWADTLASSLSGFRLEEEINTRLAEIEAAERSLLASDEERARQVSTTAFLLLPVWVFMGVTMLLGGLFFLNHGVGRRMAAEAALRELNVSLERRVAVRTAELELANRELDSFCYSVSHDLRSPLRAISGFTRVLAENHGGAFDDRDRNYMSRVLAATDRMGELIDDLLKLSRVSREELRPQPVDLSAIARKVVDGLRRESPDRAVEVTIRDGMETRGDPRLLHVMLDNLLGNAWKFSSKKPEARIEFDEVRGAEGSRVFRVRDNGVGFDMRYADKLFGPFQRLHRQHEFSGTGIGLATVQRIVHRHGGRVWAEAVVDEGATFYFSI